MTEEYAIREAPDGGWEIVDEDEMVIDVFVDREKAEESLEVLQKEAEIGEVVENGLDDLSTTLMTKFGMTGAVARKAIRDKVRPI